MKYSDDRDSPGLEPLNTAKRVNCDTVVSDISIPIKAFSQSTKLIVPT